jgi:SPX domain protein involved in polyphosphate accumulation
MKSRKEDKYVVDLNQYDKLIGILNASYKKENEYGIKSIYFDDDNFSLLKNSLNKKKFNHKFRLRKYTFDDETLFLEEKNKNINNETEKIRTEVGLDFNYKTESSLDGY